MKHYTSIKQSKKLLELGLSPESADMCWEWNDSHNIWHYVPNIIRPTTFDNIKKCIPCWSVGALMGLIPLPVLSKKSDVKWQCISIYKNKECHYVESDSSINACYKMVTWLLEMGYIKK